MFFNFYVIASLPVMLCNKILEGLAYYATNFSFQNVVGAGEERKLSMSKLVDISKFLISKHIL